MQLPTERPDCSKCVIDPETGEEIQVHDREGREIPDPVPMAPPIGYTKPLSMFDQQRAMVRAEHHRLRQLELEELQETVDQANDFEVDEDVENQPSMYEEKFDAVDYEVRQRLRQAEYRANVEAAVDKLPPHQKELLNADSLRREQQRTTEPARASHGPAGSTGTNPQPEKHASKEQEPRVSGDVRQGSAS